MSGERRRPRGKTPRMSYVRRLHDRIRQTGTPALVGLDPRWELLPGDCRGGSRADGYETFCRRVIDVVAPLVPAVKPQSAFFEALGPDGSAALARVVRHARDAGLVVLMDAKRGDIGSTAEAYAAAYLAGEDPDAAPYAADALTVSPYLGPDTLEPFTERARAVGGGLYVLVRTSNPGSGGFQDRATDGATLFEAVADHVESLNAAGDQPDGYGPVGAVVGATYPTELAALRTRMPRTPLLIPGYGSQGGTAADVAGAFDDRGLGGLVNSSRGILFAFRKGPLGESRWEEAVAEAARLMVADLADHTPAGVLRT